MKSEGAGNANDAAVVIEGEAVVVRDISASDLQVLRDNVGRANQKVDQATRDLEAAEQALATAQAELAEHEGA